MSKKSSSTVASGLSAPSLMQASPSLTSHVLKLHIPLMYSILPTFVSNLFGTIFSSSFMPSWKERYLIQLGGYFYRYKSDTSSDPKGSPFSVDEIDIYAVNDTETILPGGIITPEGYSIFCVSTLRKRQYYAISTEEDRNMWITTLQQARDEHIKRNMGHSDHVPYPYDYYDRMAKSLSKTKTRIRERVQESNMRDMEVRSMMVGDTGVMPRGYSS
mmetsp:Transcript_1019/g.1277  ORF Transcript_1019/g.1277 Transcript_1019/m.1277 type:complete len:216 (+) Transcript_1019:154-801(+)